MVVQGLDSSAWEEISDTAWEVGFEHNPLITMVKFDQDGFQRGALHSTGSSLTPSGNICGLPLAGINKRETPIGAVPGFSQVAPTLMPFRGSLR